MKVVCIFPVFPIEKHHKNMPIIVEECEKEIFPKLCKLGAISPEIKFSNIDYTYVKINQTLEGEPKGKGVLKCLKNCIDQPDYVIVCDGSGAIPYEYIVNVFQELTSDSSMCCVMANRGGNKAINESRYLIERFEIFMLRRFFNHKPEILDGQCGLWGYKVGKLDVDGCEKEIKLTAESYELELDLLSEVLKNDLSYSFVSVKLPPREAPSSFNDKNNILKMSFFLNKYSKLKDYILEYMDEFEKEKEFVERIGKTVKKEDWDKYKEGILKLIKEI